MLKNTINVLLQYDLQMFLEFITFYGMPIFFMLYFGIEQDLLDYIMSDETYELSRKLRYIAKNQDGNFLTKYTIEIDPNNFGMVAPPKNSQPSSQKIKIDSGYSDPDAKKPYQPQNKKSNSHVQQYRQTKNQKNERRNKRMRKKLEFARDQVEIFKNFNKFNTKKMRVRQDDQHDSYVQRKSNKDKDYNRKQKTYRNKGKNYVSEQSDDLDGLYDHLSDHLNTPKPQLRKRMSRSIDQSQKKQEPTKIEKKMQAFYDQKRNKKVIYPPYLNLDDIEDSRDAKQNKYFKGTIDFNERVKFYSRIFTKQIQGDLVVQGINKNRCIHGDQVYFQILSKQNSENNKGQDAMDEKIKCRVVYILPWRKDQARQIVGKIQFTPSNKTYYLVPINKRIISFDVKFSDISKQNLKKVNQKYFLAEFTGWKQTEEYPSCKIIKQFGEIGQLQSQTAALLINNGVQDKQYDEQTVKRSLDKFLKNIGQNGEYKISEQQIKKRSDLRNDTIFTIDPLTAKDFDDALSISECGQNQKGQKIYEIGVHIADASFFVQEGSQIDQRASLTTTSVYLVHRVLPMLPRILCETFCSLNPGVERLTLSVWFKMTLQGQVLPGTRYDRSIIKSKARFTYEQAQKIINKQVNNQKQIEAGFGCVKAEDFDEIANDLRIMNTIAMKVRDKRIKGGSLIFQTPKKSFKLDHNYYPIQFSVSKRFEANFLVQEYMLLANQKVGQILVENVRSFALLRRHKFPSDKKIQKFQQFTLKINNPIKINKQSPMQQQMNQLMKNPKLKQCIKQVLNYEMIFLLEQAEYFVVGDIPKAQWLHYALNMPVYTHFTSPIRRYPDIMVHRLLISVINANKKGLSKDQIQLPNFKSLKQTVDRCNKNKISAKKVSSGCQKIFLCLYLKTHPVFCKAVLTDLNQYCLSICVPSFDFRSAIQFKQLKKVKPLTFGKDSSERKYVQLQCQYEPNTFTKIILKEMQQIDVRLTAKQGFPIDYLIRLMLPHPKNPQNSITCQ